MLPDVPRKHDLALFVIERWSWLENPTSDSRGCKNRLRINNLSRVLQFVLLHQGCFGVFQDQVGPEYQNNRPGIGESQVSRTSKRPAKRRRALESL